MLGLNTFNWSAFTIIRLCQAPRWAPTPMKFGGRVVDLKLTTQIGRPGPRAGEHFSSSRKRFGLSQKKVITAVLCDNDGVLVDTETLFFETTRDAFRQMGLELTKEFWANSYLSEGHPSREIALKLGGDPACIARVLEQRNREYRRILSHGPVLRPKVRETLAALTGRVRLAIVTGCDRQQLDLVHQSTGLLQMFEVIVTSDDCTRPKPHPELYLAALKAMALAADDCIAIEDSPRGLAAAEAAGVRCMIVPTELTSALRFEGALSVEHDFSGILTRIDQ